MTYVTYIMTFSLFILQQLLGASKSMSLRDVSYCILLLKGASVLQYLTPRGTDQMSVLKELGVRPGLHTLCTEIFFAILS